MVKWLILQLLLLTITCCNSRILYQQNYGEPLVSDSQLIPAYFADEQPTAAGQESSSDDVEPTVPRDPIVNQNESEQTTDIIEKKSASKLSGWGSGRNNGKSELLPTYWRARIRAERKRKNQEQIKAENAAAESISKTSSIPQEKNVYGWRGHSYSQSAHHLPTHLHQQHHHHQQHQQSQQQQHSIEPVNQKDVRPPKASDETNKLPARDGRQLEFQVPYPTSQNINGSDISVDVSAAGEKDTTFFSISTPFGDLSKTGGVTVEDNIVTANKALNLGNEKVSSVSFETDTSGSYAKLTREETIFPKYKQNSGTNNIVVESEVGQNYNKVSNTVTINNNSISLVSESGIDEEGSGYVSYDIGVASTGQRGSMDHTTTLEYSEGKGFDVSKTMNINLDFTPVKRPRPKLACGLPFCLWMKYGRKWKNWKLGGDFNAFDAEEAGQDAPNAAEQLIGGGEGVPAKRRRRREAVNRSPDTAVDSSNTTAATSLVDAIAVMISEFVIALQAALHDLRTIFSRFIV